MRLAILMSVASPWSREAALQLVNMGEEIHVIDFEEVDGSGYLYANDEFQSSSIAAFRRSVAKVHLLKGSPSVARYIRSAPMLNAVLGRCGAQCLLTLYGGGFATMAYLSGFRPYAVYLVGSEVLLLNRIKRWISSRALASAEVVFANGGYLAQKSRELAPRANLIPLLLGVATDRFVPGAPCKSPVKIVCSRGFVSVYNNEYLIQALAHMPQPLRDFQVTFVSSGPTLGRVRNMADKLLSPPLRTRVKFRGGVTDQEMLAELQDSHIYVSLSRSDGTSTSLLEALSCGLFPILSDIPQNREWVDGNNGIIVPLDRPEVLSRALARAIEHPELRMQAIACNRRLVMERATSSRNMAFLASQLETMNRGSVLKAAMKVERSS